MNKYILKSTLTAAGVLAVIGTVGAQAYTSHEQTGQVAEQQPVQQSGTPTDTVVGLQDPWDAMHEDMMRMQTHMQQMFNSAYHNFHTMGAGGRSVNAKVTLEEHGDNYIVRADIPGADESDINVNLDGRLLSISPQSQGAEKQTKDDGQIIRQESYANSFQQAFTLPGPVKANSMHTRFKDGVLTVTIPKATS